MLGSLVVRALDLRLDGPDRRD